MYTSCWTLRRMPTNCSAKLGDRSDKKTLKRMGTLKDYAENWGNHYALPKPKTPEEKREREGAAGQAGPAHLPYDPNPLENGAFEESPEGVICDCCGKTTPIFDSSPLLSVEDIEYLCPECIAQR